MQIFPTTTTRLMLPGPAGALEVMVELPKTPSKVVFIMCHPDPCQQGSMNNKVVTTVMRAMLNLNVTAVRFNFRGVGKSEGEYGEVKGELLDLLAVIDWVQKSKPDAEIWLGGFSFGGAIAYMAANQRPVSQLLTIAPGVTRIDVSASSEPAMPWILVQGESDEVIEATAIFAWLEALSVQPKVIKMPGVGHFFHGELINLRKLLIDAYTPRVPQ